MEKRKKTGGRQKGTPNRMTLVAKDAFQLAFDRIGGADNLAKWASNNESEFYKLYSRLIPVDVNANVQARITVNDDIPAK